MVDLFTETFSEEKSHDQKQAFDKPALYFLAFTRIWQLSTSLVYPCRITRLFGPPYDIECTWKNGNFNECKQILEITNTTKKTLEKMNKSEWNLSFEIHFAIRARLRHKMFRKLIDTSRLIPCPVRFSTHSVKHWCFYVFQTMNMIYVLFPVLCSLAICFGDLVPADTGAWQSDTANLQAKRRSIDYFNNGMKAACNPGFWCSKREASKPSPILTTEENSLLPEEEPRLSEDKPLPEQRNREFICLPGTVCRKRSRIMTGQTEEPARRTRVHHEGKRPTVWSIYIVV